MIKLIGPLAKTLFAVFILAVFAGVMYYSYQALGMIFPGDLTGQLFGMALFDIAALVWFLVFVKESHSTMQYVFSAIGFMLGLVGTLGLVGIEVGLSSGLLEHEAMARPLSYIFIGVLLGHLVLIYARHAAAPEISADISFGVERARITDQAKKDAERMLIEQTRTLALPIAQRHVMQVMRELNLDVDENGFSDLKEVETDQSGESKGSAGWQNFLSWLPGLRGNGAKKYQSSVASVEQTSPQQTPTQSPVAGDVGREDGEESMQES